MRFSSLHGALGLAGLALFGALGVLSTDGCALVGGIHDPGPTTCIDGIKNGKETDVDCGDDSGCGKCAGGSCSADADCASVNCVAGKCLAATCEDGRLNGVESDQDCGGWLCASEGHQCAAGKLCRSDCDCASGPCGDDGFCKDSGAKSCHCADGKKDADETGVDCGGLDCKRCEETDPCHNGVQDPGEEGVDCGGTCLETCNVTQCQTDADCASLHCVTDPATSAGHCVDATCDDNRKNGNEVGIDCGGPDCPACMCGSNPECPPDTFCVALGGALECATCAHSTTSCRDPEKPCLVCDSGGCTADEDCSSKVCSQGVCASPTCDDKVLNGLESDLDCGAVCPTKCPIDGRCTQDADCASNHCLIPSGASVGACAATSCSDNMQNGFETGVDCGGPDCKPCLVPACSKSSDCEPSTFCVENTSGPQTTQCAACAPDALHCHDPDPSSCPLCENAACASLDQCLSRACVSGRCVPSCTDTFQDGDETGIDCGGSCTPCKEGQACLLDKDCATGFCNSSHTCALHCSDGVMDGDETGVDCGGSCPMGCGVNGSNCAADTDCASGYCGGAVCRPKTCIDGMQNGNETSTDCGDPACLGCTGDHCNAGVDCIMGVCEAGDICE